MRQQKAITLPRSLRIAFLSFSAVLFWVNLGSAKACAIPSTRNILLDQPPTKLHKASFMSKVKITRATTLTSMILIRGIIEESQTHPHLVSEKVILIHDGTFYDSLCPMDIRAGYEGYVIGRTMKLNTDVLIVDPYITDNFLGSIDEANIDTGKDKFPLRHFYKP